MNRRGFALAAALLFLVLIAALVAGVFFAGTEEGHIAVNTSGRERALAAAESAMDAMIGGWSGRGGQEIGLSGAELSTVTDGEVRVSLTVTRLDSTLYSIVAEARSASSQGAVMRRFGVVVAVGNAIDNVARADPIPERWWSEFL